MYNLTCSWCGVGKWQGPLPSDCPTCGATKLNLDYGDGPLQVGQRVELSPACDLWMRGERYGKVAATGVIFTVKTDRGYTVKVAPSYLKGVK